MMISQKQMKLWIPEALEQFQLAMPAVNAPYPEIRFASDRTMEKVRIIHTGTQT